MLPEIQTRLRYYNLHMLSLTFYCFFIAFPKKRWTKVVEKTISVNHKIVFNASLEIAVLIETAKVEHLISLQSLCGSNMSY